MLLGRQIRKLRRGRQAALIDAEERFLGTTHCEIGLLIAQKWNFPSEYCEVISNHHSPQEATLDPTLSAIVNLADYFCSVRQLDYGGRGWVSFNLADEGAWEVLKKFAPHMRNFDVERFCYELDDRVPEIQEMVKSGVKYELEALSRRGISFVTEEYLPKKLRDRDWLE